MNKMTKLGVSALCGSLAAVSAANAGEMTVTGGVDMSWVSLQDDTTGNPLGMGSNLTFSGSGELDNGWGVALSIAHNNQNTYSATNVTVSIPSLGDVLISHGVSGSGIDRMDDITPNVWEEAYATGLSTGIQTIAGVAGSSSIEITPSAIMPDGLTARIAISPNAGGSKSADKGVSGAGSAQKGSGYDVTLAATDAIHGISGMTVSAGYSEIEQDATHGNYNADAKDETVAVNYAIGSFTVGYQWSEKDLGLSTGASKYTNDGYGVTFNVNDDLSIGYNHFESEQTNTTNVTAEATSIQVAYTMGGASIRLAQASVDNAKYQTTAMYDKDATTLSISLAF
jgi:outer membrane protein OmpU